MARTAIAQRDKPTGLLRILDYGSQTKLQYQFDVSSYSVMDGMVWEEKYEWRDVPFVHPCILDAEREKKGGV